MLCCGYTLTDFPISIRLTSLALWQSNDCPSASKATLMNMDKYFMWIHYERLHNHNKAKHNKTVCIFLGIYCILFVTIWAPWLALSQAWNESAGLETTKLIDSTLTYFEWSRNLFKLQFLLMSVNVLMHMAWQWQWQWQWKYVYYHRFTYIQDTGCKISIHWK